MSGERTEKPTQKRLKKARSEGRTPRTPELGAWLGMLTASMLLPMVVRHAMAAVQDMMLRVPEVIARPDINVALNILGAGTKAGAIAVAPLAFGLMLVGILAAAGQGGLHFSGKVVVPKLNRLNPMPGIKRAFGPKALWETAKAVTKTAVLGGVLYWSVRRLLPSLMGAGALPLAGLLGTTTAAVVTLVRAAAMAGLAMAVLDYLVVRRTTMKKLKMTKQEIKDEYKGSEGDPQVKQAIRSRQLAMSRNRMMAELDTADVILVNPTHVAVALRYEPDKGAPRVVAKGSGVIATRIRDRASELRLPMVRDVPLARALHDHCELGQEIPPDLYTAVARVLAFVMTLRARGSAAGLHNPAAA